MRIFAGSSEVAVHRAMGRTWLKYEEQKGFEFDHIDQDSHNNRALNLKYISHEANCRKRVSRWGFEERHGKFRVKEAEKDCQTYDTAYLANEAYLLLKKPYITKRKYKEWRKKGEAFLLEREFWPEQPAPNTTVDKIDGLARS